MGVPEALHFTGNDEADRLLATDPMALLIGFALDQQVPVPTAFTGPLKIKQRLGSLDPAVSYAHDLHRHSLLRFDRRGDFFERLFQSCAIPHDADFFPHCFAELIT